MSDNDKQIVKIATNFVLAILKHGEPTGEALSDIYKISNGNKKLLLEHLKAIHGIIGKAIGILGGNKDE